ncbi:DUF308 domain-containing protein [Sphingomonas sp. MMS12-HWE2-04]|uniref:DUF308 domain-containing protein n=1 Tax=Sphingomonas sp. MMS12-HWE2-04 TaxID=3234199 RepID=UPI00384DBC32
MDASAARAATWLRSYYFARALVGAAWVAAAATIGTHVPAAAATLLVAYPAWDAAANLIDARASGGLVRNRTQALNLVVSSLTAAAVLAMLGNPHAVLGIFGLWATLAGLLQLATGVRRWKSYGAQWAMVLSGAQSALAGGFFGMRALGSAVPGIADIIPYATFGAFYFLVSALWLSFRKPAR